MNYKIIHDEDKLREFIDWLPEVEKQQTYYLSLFARNKYCREVIKVNDKQQLKRFTSNKEQLFDKIKQLECPLGSYKIRDVEIPQEALALYITINPRDLKKATTTTLKKCVDAITNPDSNFLIKDMALSAIQKSRYKCYYKGFDIDSKLIDLSFMNFLGKDDYKIIETRGGYHIYVDTNTKGHWYNFISDLYKDDIDTSGNEDLMSPVVGCIQGGFVPRFIDYYGNSI